MAAAEWTRTMDSKWAWRRGAQFTVKESGTKKGIVLPMKAHREHLEDIDNLTAAAVQDKPAISFNDLWRRLRDDGLI